MSVLPEEIRSLLRENFEKQNITLYLGAGVSIDNNILSWEKLILAMYFSTISQQHMGGWRPFSNYLYAISEWYLRNSSEPLDITARKLRMYHESETAEQSFLESLYYTLYGSMLDQNSIPYSYVDSDFIRQQNKTMNAVAELCESPRRGIKAVITYNYDNLLEMSLGTSPHQTIFGPDRKSGKQLPIFHVHGYVPLDRYAHRSKEEDIVFTEDQYHRISGDAYFWSNLVQIQHMSNSVGVMIGLSLSDKNMRRLLDAVGDSPIQTKNFALLKEPDQTAPPDEDLDEIHEQAIKYLDRFKDGGIKSNRYRGDSIFFHPGGIKSTMPGMKSSRMGEKGPAYRHEISGIIEQVKRLNMEQQEYILQQLGITPIWFEKYTDIPTILKQIYS